MKKLIALSLLVGASVVSAVALAEDAQQAAPKDAVMQQLADNSSTDATAATDATANTDQAAAPAKKATKHHVKKHTHHHPKKDTTAPAAAPSDAAAPAADATPAN